MKKILEVTLINLEIRKTNPLSLMVHASGKVNSGGWAKGQLIPFIYINPPQDGLYEFDFVAEPPIDLSTDAIEEISAVPFEWIDFPSDLRGVKVYASSNFIQALTDEVKKDSSLIESQSPFNKVDPKEFQRLRENSHLFSITNSFMWEDTLHASVRYSGGCEKHEFQLVWDGTILKSNPPQYPLSIIHNNNGDKCKAIVTEELQFVLTEHIQENAVFLLEGWQSPLTF